MSRRIRFMALMMACSFMLSASACDNGNTRTRDTDDEQEETVEETVVETSAEASETTAEETSDEDAPSASSDNDEAFEAYMNFVDSFVEQYEGDVYFRFERNHSDDGDRWNLHVSYPSSDMTEIYEYLNGDMNYIGTLDYYDSHAMSYGLFHELPCMIDFFGDQYGDSIEEAADGRYFGNMEAASADGTQILLAIGDPFILTEEEYNALQVGDVLDVPALYTGDEPGITVTDIVEENGSRNVILDEDGEYYFMHDSYTGDSSDYILMTVSDNPLWFNPRMIIVDLADNCAVTDIYEYLFDDDDLMDFSVWSPEPGTSPLASSAFWFYENRHSDPEEVNGWVPIGGLVYPVVIENGEVTSINIEWR